VIEGGSIGQALGRSCTLGLFHSVTMEDLESRFAPHIQQRRFKKMEAPPIEYISGEDAEKVEAPPIEYVSGEDAEKETADTE
jgi:hypothetical protein